MFTNNVKLQLIELQSAEPTIFGSKGVAYFPYEAITDKNDKLVVFVSESTLRKAGLNPAFDTEMVLGSHLIVQDSYDRDGNLEFTAEERIESVLSGDRNFLITSSANAKLQKSKELVEILNRQKTDIMGRVVVEREREREFRKMQDAAQRLRERALRMGSTAAPAPDADNEQPQGETATVPTAEAVAEPEL